MGCKKVRSSLPQLIWQRSTSANESKGEQALTTFVLSLPNAKCTCAFTSLKPLVGLSLSLSLSLVCANLAETPFPISLRTFGSRVWPEKSRAELFISCFQHVRTEYRGWPAGSLSWLTVWSYVYRSEPPERQLGNEPYHTRTGVLGGWV